MRPFFQFMLAQMAQIIDHQTAILLVQRAETFVYDERVHRRAARRHLADGNGQRNRHAKPFAAAERAKRAFVAAAPFVARDDFEFALVLALRAQIDLPLAFGQSAQNPVGRAPQVFPAPA